MGVIPILLVVTITTTVILLLLTWWLEYRMIFHPSSEWVWSPPLYDDVYLPIDDELIHGQYIEVDRSAPTVLFYHGNSGNISHRSYMVHLCQLYKLNLLMFDYRGYGKSTGYSNLKRLYEDANVTAIYAVAKYKNLIVWGESLGGGIATYVASKYPCSKLILASTFSSLDDIITAKNASFVNRSCSTILRQLIDTIPSKDRIGDIQVPIAIMHSIDDELIPYSCSKSLLRRVTSEGGISIDMTGSHAKPNLSVSNVQELMRWIHGFDLVVDSHALDLFIEEIKTVKDRYSL